MERLIRGKDSANAMNRIKALFKGNTNKKLYAAMVYVMFECPQTFNMTCMRVLGHRDIQDSLSYSDLRLEGCDAIRGVHGPLQL